MALNYLCAHDASDEDCKICSKHGIRFRCIDNCPNFKDVRKGMPEEMLIMRSELMEKVGLTDRLPWEVENGNER